MDPATRSVGDPSAEASHRTKGLLRLTMACNERCPFCNVPAEDYPRPTPEDAAIASELDAFVASGERTLTISGGEPTLLRRRLLAVIRGARERGVPYVELQTNAVLVDAAYAAALASAGLTSAFVSLLSDLPDLHDRLAGLDGAFARCHAGIDALLDAGVRVTLNPVTASLTEERLPAYVDHVATRLPRVRSISLSAVQPHGRAREHLDLLPDYARLRPAVREARTRAEAHGIELLNPYCGLPLCVGWEDGLEASVEAVEASSGGWRATPGIENEGDKRQGPACRGCVLRARCGGAWHAYWEVRGGSGLRPPARLGGPSRPSAYEQVVDAPGGPTPGTWDAVRAQPGPFVWVRTDRLTGEAADALLDAGASGLALELPPGDDALLDAAPLRGLHRLARRRRERPDARRPAIWLRVAALASLPRAVQLARALDLDALVVPDAPAALTSAWAARTGVDVRGG